MADKIDQLKIGTTFYDIDLPPDATPTIAGLTVDNGSMSQIYVSSHNGLSALTLGTDGLSNNGSNQLDIWVTSGLKFEQSKQDSGGLHVYTWTFPEQGGTVALTDNIAITNSAVSTTGSGNAVTGVSISNGQIVATKGTSFATSSQLASKQDALTFNPTIPSGTTTTTLTTLKNGSNYYSLGGGDSLPKVTIVTSQVISQNPLQIQLTNEQYTTMNGQSVIFDGSALGMSIVVADYNGPYIDDNNTEYLTFIFPYNEYNGDNIDFYKILVNKSTKVAGLDSAYPQRAITAGFADTVLYDTSVPTSANTSGGIKVVVLSSEPATRYDGYLYIITEPAVTIISFRINNTTYQAEEGMTWAEWCDSEYNTDGYYVSGNTIKTGRVYIVDAVPTGTILNEDAYSAAAYGGAD